MMRVLSIIAASAWLMFSANAEAQSVHEPVQLNLNMLAGMIAGLDARIAHDGSAGLLTKNQVDQLQDGQAELKRGFSSLQKSSPPADDQISQFKIMYDSQQSLIRADEQERKP